MDTHIQRVAMVLEEKNCIMCSLAFAAIPVQAWTGPQGSWWLRLAECRQSAHEGLRLLFLCTGRLYPPPPRKDP